MKLYLIRHGQSEANIGGYYAGQMQVKLTEIGVNQAKNVSQLINHINFDKIYSSDLYRAIDTCKNALPAREFELTPLLREIDVGDLAGQNAAMLREKMGQSLINNQLNYNFEPYNGENSVMLSTRVESFLNIVTASNYHTVAAFTHGGFITTTLEFLLNVKTDKYIFTADNCSITKLDYTNGKWRIELYNYTGTI